MVLFKVETKIKQVLLVALSQSQWQAPEKCGVQCLLSCWAAGQGWVFKCLVSHWVLQCLCPAIRSFGMHWRITEALCQVLLTSPGLFLSW